MAMRTDGYGHGARPTIVGLMTVVMLMVVISNAWPAQETATVPAVAGDTANEGRLFLAASDGESGIASDFFLATPDRTGKWAASSGDWDVRLRIEGNAVNGRFAWNDVTKSYNGNIRGKIDEYGLLEGAIPRRNVARLQFVRRLSNGVSLLRQYSPGGFEIQGGRISRRFDHPYQAV